MCGSSCLCIGVMTLGTRASLVMTWERTNLISKGHKHEIKKGIWVESNGQPKTEECVASLIFPTRFVSATQHNTTATTQNCRQTSNCSGLTKAPILAHPPDKISLQEISYSLIQSISKRKLESFTLHCDN